MVQMFVKARTDNEAISTQRIIGESEAVYAEKLQDKLETEAGQENLLFKPLSQQAVEQTTNFFTPNKMSAEDANAQYGVPGYLKFEGPVSQDYAFQRNMRSARRAKVDQYLIEARKDDTSFFEKTENLFNYLKGGGLDQPIALMLGGGVGGVNNLTAARYLGRAPMMAPVLKNPLSRSLTFGALEEVGFLPARKQVYNDLGQEYGPLQMSVDVLTSGLLEMGGGAFRTFFGGKNAMERRALGPKGRAALKAGGGPDIPPPGGGDVMSGEMDEFLSPAEQQNKIINQQMTPEGREVAAGYIQRSLDEGVEPSPQVVEDILALSKKNEAPELRGSQPFYSDYILRTDFDSMDPAQQMSDATHLASRNLFDDKAIDIVDSESNFNTRKTDLLNKLNINERMAPEYINNIRDNKLPYLKGQLEEAELRFKRVAKERDFIQKQLANETDDVKKIQLGKQLSELYDKQKSAFNEQKSIDKEIRKLIGNATSLENLIEENRNLRISNALSRQAIVNPVEAVAQVKRLQQQLQKVTIDAEAKPKAFKKAFLDAKAKFDSFPELRNATLAKLDTVSKEARDAAVNYLKYLQSANLSSASIEKVLAGNIKAIREMQNSIQFNSKMKDGITAKEVYDRLEKNIMQQDTHDLSAIGIPKTAQQAINVEVPKVQLDESMQVSLSFMQEQIASLEKQIPEAQTTKIKKDLEPQSKMVGEDLEKIVNMLNCLKG